MRGYNFLICVNFEAIRCKSRYNDVRHTQECLYD